jgi:transcriptional accessory protein Tex/SPT6
MFSSTAVLTTTATVKGKEEIDQEHQYWGLQSLVAVPIHALLENPMLWARIRTAAKEGFLTLRLDVPGAIEQSGSKKWHARNDLDTAMGGDGGGPAWESVRKSIATQVLTTLFTKASRSSHAKMTALAHEAILNEACTSLRRKLVQAPIKLDDLDEGAFSLMRALTRDQLEEGGMYAGETPLPRSRRGMGTAQGHGLGLRSRSNSSASSAQQEADLQLHRQKMHSLTRDVSSA